MPFLVVTSTFLHLDDSCRKGRHGRYLGVSRQANRRASCNQIPKETVAQGVVGEYQERVSGTCLLFQLSLSENHILFSLIDLVDICL